MISLLPTSTYSTLIAFFLQNTIFCNLSSLTFIWLTLNKPTSLLIAYSFNFMSSYIMTRDNIVISIVKYLAQILQCDDQDQVRRFLGCTFRQLQSLFTQPNLKLRQLSTKYFALWFAYAQIRSNHSCCCCCLFIIVTCSRAWIHKH